MLIKTERHTKNDLEFYKSYQEIDKINLWSKKKEKISIDVIKNTDAKVVYTSWGKDSIVLLDLLKKAGRTLPVVYVKFNDRFNPDAELVRDCYLEKNDLPYHEEIFDYSEVRKNDKHWKICAKKFGNHRITGIRNDESSKRTLVYKMFKHDSKNSCRPLSLWKLPEIFSYIEQNELPLSPVYGYVGGGRYNRDNLRMHSLAGSSGDGMGRSEWEREYYSDVLNRIMQQKYLNNK